MPLVPAPPPGSSVQQDIAYYASLLSANFPGRTTTNGNTLAQDYSQYMQAHSSADPATVYEQVVSSQSSGSGSGGIVQSVESAVAGFVKDLTNPLGIFTQIPSSWLSSIGGWIASGLEQGFVSLVQDIWNVIEGPILIIAGVVVFLFVLIAFFKNDIAAAGYAAGGAFNALTVAAA